jgi:hypothetical protein
MALDRLGRPASVLLLFATTGHDQAEVLAGIADVAGQTPLSGCSGEGVITRSGSDEGSHALAVMAIASDRAAFVPLLATDLPRGPRECARALAEQIRSRPDCSGRYLILFPDGITGNGSALLSALEDSLPLPLVMVGGAAGSNISLPAKTYQYYNNRVVSDSVAALLVGGDVSVDTTVSHGSTPIGLERSVTRSDGGTVYEIDGRPAWEVFREYLEGNPTDLVQEDCAHLGFGEKLPPELVGPYGEYIMRTPSGVDKKTGALFFPGELPTGAKIRVARRDPDRIREGATEAARELASRRSGKSPSLVLQFDCTGRGRIIFSKQAIDMTMSGIQSAFGRDVPWLGLHTLGEIAPLGGKALFHNQTVVLCALYDAEPAVGPPG